MNDVPCIPLGNDEEASLVKRSDSQRSHHCMRESSVMTEGSWIACVIICIIHPAGPVELRCSNQCMREGCMLRGGTAVANRYAQNIVAAYCNQLQCNAEHI